MAGWCCPTLQAAGGTASPASGLLPGRLSLLSLLRLSKFQLQLVLDG